MGAAQMHKAMDKEVGVIEMVAEPVTVCLQTLLQIPLHRPHLNRECVASLSTIYVKISSMTDSKTESKTARERLQQENPALVERLYVAFAEQNIPALLKLLSPEIDWLFYGPDSIPFAGHYHGREQVKQFFTRALETTEFLVFEPREFIAGSNTILVQGYERGRARSTDRIWETEWAHVFTIENAQIIKMREYYDTAVIAEAFNLNG